MSFVRNMASTLAASVLVIPVAFVTSVVLARTLSVEDYGLYGLLMTLASTLCLVSQLGLPVAVIYAVRRLQLSPARVVSSTLVAGVASTALVAAGSLALREPLSTHFLDGADTRFLLVVLVVSFCQLLGAALSGVARAIDRFDVQNGYTLVEVLAVLLGAVGMLWLWEPTLRAALVGALLGELASAGWFAAMVIARTGWTWDPGVLVRSTAGFALRAWLQQLAMQAHERIGVFLLAYFASSTEQVAPFLVALGLVRIVKVAPTAIATALFPQLAGFERDDAAHFTARVMRHALLWSVAVCLVLLPAGVIGIPIVYGTAYAAAVVPFALLLPSTAGLTVSQIVSRYFAAFDMQWTVIGVRTFAALANLLLNVWLIPREGVVGAAMASLASYTIEASMIVGIFLWRAGARPRQLLFGAEDLALYVDRARPWLRRIGLPR
jgi:O-antigen/teichoic acid export membrane protein